MAMEPISGIVSFQGQNLQQTVQTKPVTSSGKGAEEFVQQTSESAQSPDATLVTVHQVDENEKDKDATQSKHTAVYAQQEKKKKEEKEKQEEELFEKEHEMLKETVELLNKRMYNHEAQFGIHEKTNRMTIKIIDKETKEVIKEVPPENTLELFAKSLELAGLLVDEKG